MNVRNLYKAHMSVASAQLLEHIRRGAHCEKEEDRTWAEFWSSWAPTETQINPHHSLLIVLAADNKKDSSGGFLFASATIRNEMLNVSWAKKRAEFVFVLSTREKERDGGESERDDNDDGKEKRKATESDKRQDGWGEQKEADGEAGEDGWRCGSVL